MYMSVGVYMNIVVGIYTEGYMYIILLHVLHFDIMMKNNQKNL